MTDKEKQKVLKYLEEFELVNPTTGEVYIEKDVYIDLTIGKNGKYEYDIKDKDMEEIGKCLDKKSIILSAKYKEKKQKKIDGKEFDFDADLEVDIDKMLERQQEKEKIEKAKLVNENRIREENDEKIEDEKNRNNDENDKNQKQQEKDKNELDKQKDNEEQVENTPISQEELKKQGYNISTYSLITDVNIINALLVDDYNPRSVIVAEVEGQIKFLAREVGTGDIKELPQVPTSSSGEQVNEFNGGVESKTVVSNKVALANCPGMEFSIDKNKIGQIELYSIDNIDGEGDREALPVKTQAIHPTMEEYKRTVYEKYGYEFDDRMEEIKDRLDDEEKSIRDVVGKKIGDMEELPDDNKLDEMIEEEEYEQEREKDIEKEKEEEEEKYKAPWDGHDLYRHP